MGEAYLRNAGTGVNKSFIVVTAPTGSTVTCSNGSTVRHTAEKNGTWVFSGLNAGTYTVKATLGTYQASKTIELGKNVVENVTLTYVLVLFDAANGGDQTEATGGWDVSAYAGISTDNVYASGNAYAGGGNATTKNAIDISPYKTLTAKGTMVSGYPLDLFGSWGLTGSAAQSAKGNLSSKVREYNIDVSAVTDSRTIYLRGNGTWVNYEAYVCTIRFSYIALLP